MHAPDKMDEEQSSILLSDVTSSDEHDGDDTLKANVKAEATIAPGVGRTTAPAALGSAVAEGCADNSDDVVNGGDADHGRSVVDDSQGDQDLTYHDGLTEDIIGRFRESQKCLKCIFFLVPNRLFYTSSRKPQKMLASE